MAVFLGVKPTVKKVVPSPSYADLLKPAPDAGPSLSQILEQITKVLGATAPQAPVKEEDLIGPQPGIADLIKQLGLDKDFEAEAAKVLAARGVERPVKPKPHEIGWGAAIAALGPALGAFAGGMPSMAAPGVAAVLGGHRAAWEAEDKKYGENLSQYLEQSEKVVDRMQTRATQQASMLLPYFALTPAERIAAKVSVQNLNIAWKSLDLTGKQVALQGVKLGFDRQAQLDEARYRQNMYVLDILKSIDAKAASDLQAALDREKFEADKEYQAALLSIQKGELDVSRYNAQTARMAASAKAGSMQSVIDKVKDAIIADLYVRAMKGDADAMKEMKLLTFGSKGEPGQLTEADKSVVDAWTRIQEKPSARTAMPKELLEQRRLAYNEVARRMGWPESSPMPETRSIQYWRWFRGMVGI